MKGNSMLRIFIGYDSREHVPYEVCKHSIRRHSSAPVDIIKLEHRELRRQGLFDRPWRIEGNGQYWDITDGKPFSTEFSHTRFLVPEICRRNGMTEGWAMFCDSDFLFRADVCELFDMVNNDYAVMCVKHDYTLDDGIKMDGMVQQNYNKKLWSSLVLWNIGHPKNNTMDRTKANHSDGSYLHQFGWLDNSDIGTLPHSWNYVPDVSPDTNVVKAVHYSLGGPWFRDYRETEYAKEWLNEVEHLNSIRGRFKI